jgi:hypothetical protein
LQRLVEAVVLAKDLADRRFVLREQRKNREVHLTCQRLFDLLRPRNALLRLVELTACVAVPAPFARSRGHRDEQQRDNQEGAHQLRVKRYADSGDPANQSAQRGPGQHDSGELLELNF